MIRVTLPLLLVGETRLFDQFDFTAALASGETISTQTCTATVYSGTDASPSGVVSGSASASGAVVSQKLYGQTVGVIYDILCTITTSASQTLKMHGFLSVVPAR